ncbi:proline dehydrogenase 1, mitochondrial-like isoform X4 [Branchiostoma floridae]|uniref:Proline dehydrogenase n=1 Tax=Branchiostoma floridae TaxID=7739 RepID=A0A9J7N389_BRAFL|nr:proline dehydrogenase 1, mitochondrial-like isoform X4 [Branchiostoma floridae]
MATRFTVGRLCPGISRRLLRPQTAEVRVIPVRVKVDMARAAVAADKADTPPVPSADRPDVPAEIPEVKSRFDIRHDYGEQVRQFPIVSLNFDDALEAYKSKTTGEILRALLVFKLCSFDIIVRNNNQLMKLSRRILGKRLFKSCMKGTFYGHFVAGEDQESIKPLIKRMEKFGVGSILDYSVEEDLSRDEAVSAEMDDYNRRRHYYNSCISSAEPEQSEIHSDKYKAHEEFGDRREDVVSARTYFYEDEHKCDENLKIFLNCIKAAGYSSTDGFAAIKLTALGRPQLLLQLSDVLSTTRQFFEALTSAEKKLPWVKRKLTKEVFQNRLEELGVPMSRDESGWWFTWMDQDASGDVDLLEWNQMLKPNHSLRKLFVVPNIETGELEPAMSSITEEEEQQMKNMLQRMNLLAEAAKLQGVRLMVDAEQTYFQPAIARLTVEMMRKFNQERPVIFNTYQCYLKDAYNNLYADMDLARKEGWHFGCKLVRGAYMEQERKRAEAVGYEDPINPDYEATNRMYHKCLDHMLTRIDKYGDINVMVASHNEDTVKHAIQRMRELNISPADQTVYFGQLLGMCDQVSFPLGQAGYPVFKYVPYGPVEEVLPYLSRRAQENSAILKGAYKERMLLWTELKRRLSHLELVHNPDKVKQ